MLKPGTIPFSEASDPTPIAKPTRLQVPTQSDRIMQMVLQKIASVSQHEELETFEEADDFELDEGEQWFSPYEQVFEPDETLAIDAPPVAPATPTAPPPEPVPAPVP